jgi:hypothetical protein
MNVGIKNKRVKDLNVCWFYPLVPRQKTMFQTIQQPPLEHPELRSANIYSFVHLQLIHHCKNKLLVTKSLVLTTWAGGAAKVSSLLMCGGGKGQELS